ncbi:ArsR family transcriptional regulator [Candidatus Bathyarchaeota archaeon]|nr:MAG: ArsR family transcriptional regulator [Candidatus Bathyarchaeota archaeon]
MSKPREGESATLKRAVKIVDEPKILMDPVRREILRLLAIRPLTATQLAEKLGLTKSTVSHHIQVLKRAGLIRIKWTRLESHGILEKYYEPTALLFIEDYHKIPKGMKNHFLMVHMERLRGVLIALYLMGRKVRITRLMKKSTGREAGFSREPDPLRELAGEVLECMTKLGAKYENELTDMDGETLLVKIYGEALRSIMSRNAWRSLNLGL